MKHPGPYVPLDVNYARDRAIASAGEAAELLYVRGLAYCKHTYSDGFIPDYDIDEVAKRLKKVPERIAALVREGLWTVVDGGWLVRNWSRWNESTDDVKAKRERDAERQRRRRSQAKDDLGTTEGVTADVQRDTERTPSGVTALIQDKTETEQTKAVVLPDEPPDDPTTRLLAEHVNAYPDRLPTAATAKVKVEIMRLVADGIEPHRIRAGLARLREKSLSASLLPQLVSETTAVRQSDNTRILAAARERARQAEDQQRKAIG